ncbi:hypothetical protein GI584_11545 [Gracilibacillus salitolerans]|uniref:Uncharacterized protein n=1 Tax=Gracilibacillus salitolerans TaxID=2663022 RepID=A0A5Q2TKL2_9BACI|nr:hypothetical protein [Gracilibacillus salitolerans]QGH34627.1 hypothetical protein GI584_11545 [Gracilibacillus salitolerans]
MVDDEQSVSKLYRKVLTSSEVKAFLILEKCDDELKQELMKKLEENDSVKARVMIKRLHRRLNLDIG